MRRLTKGCRKSPGARTFLSAALSASSNSPSLFRALSRVARCCGQECPMPLGFGSHPGGMFYNSPTFQRWVDGVDAISSPGGTKDPFVGAAYFAPGGAWIVRDASTPAINRWAIFGCPCGTETSSVASNPSGIGQECPRSVPLLQQPLTGSRVNHPVLPSLP